MYLRAACFAQKQWFLFVFLAALFILLLSGTPPLVSARNKNQRKFVLIFNDQEARSESLNAELSSASSASDDADQEDSEQQDDFNDPDDFSLEDLDPGSWLIIAENFEPKEEKVKETEGDASMNAAGMSYMSGVSKLLDAASLGDPNTLAESVDQFLQAAQVGHPDAHSTLAFLYRNGIGVEHNDAKAFLYHSFAADAGNFQSKLALAYNYFRQQINEEAVRVYAELAGRAVASFSSALDSPLVEHVPLNDGLEENKEALKRYRGEEDDDFQILEYQARKGNAGAMFKVGLFYYSGLRGIQRDDAKALYWFLKGIEKGDTTAMEFVGEIYARGHGVERNFTKALEWFKAALRNKRFSAYNGIGYLYVKGLGVDKRNYTVARDFFKKAAEHDDPDGHYNLGILYLQGKGVKKDVEAASKYFVEAANAGHPKAYYQLAKLFQKGLGVKKDLAMATVLYKMVAERGPWGSLMRWALESYLKGDVGKALLLYSRAAELGYEIAQSNAAWILERYHELEYCLGESGFCKTGERYRRAHTLWWHASEQGNDDAALLIGDAYYYGRPKPEIRYTQKLIGGNLNAVPGLSDMIKGIVESAVADSLEWPHRIVVPIAQPPVDLSDLELKLQGKLTVTVVRAQSLKNMDMIGKSDPYVMAYVRVLFPSTTKVIDNNLNPMWDETFDFDVEDQETQSLVLQVYDKDIGNDKLLGVATCPLVKLTAEETKELVLPLTPSLEMDNVVDKRDRGQLTIRVKYHIYSKEEQKEAMEKERAILAAKKEAAEAGLIGGTMDVLGGAVGGAGKLVIGGAGAVGSGVGMVGSGIGKAGKLVAKSVSTSFTSKNRKENGVPGTPK